MGSYVFASDKGDAVQRSADGAFIPWDAENARPLNAESFVYRQWLDDGSPIPGQYVAPPVPLQDEISPRQFFEEADFEGIITKPEALAFMASKTVPKILADPIAQMPEDLQFRVMMALMGAIYSRRNPFTDMIGQLIGKDAAAMDAFWRAASKR